MGQSLDALESILLHHGGGVPPINHHDAKPQTIRTIIATTIGHIIGFFVAVWCIFRSVDSMFAPRYHPNDDSFVFLVSTDSQSSSSKTVNENKNDKDKILRKSTFRDNFASRNNKVKRDLTNNLMWAPRSYHCKIVDIRSKQTGTAIARLGGSHRKSESTNELRRRLIEFTIETRSKDLNHKLSNSSSSSLNGTSTSTSVDGKGDETDPVLVMANDLQQIGLGNANGNGNNNDNIDSVLAGKVIRRQADCETLKSQILGGVIPLDDQLRTACTQIFNQVTNEDQVSTGGTPVSTSSSDKASTESSSDPAVAVSKRRYLGFSASSGSDLDLSMEMSLCVQLESAINLILSASAERKQAPHAIVSDFLGITSSINKSAMKSSSSKSLSSSSSSVKKLSVKTTNNVASESDYSGSGEDLTPTPSTENQSSHSVKPKKSSSSNKSSHKTDDIRSSVESIHESSASTSERSSSGGGGSGGNLASAMSVDSLKNLDDRASLMPEGVTQPLPPKSEWPDYPVLIRCSEDVDMKIGLEGVSAYGALPINDAAHPIPFETTLFKGVAMIRIADLSTSPMEYFKGRRRKMQVCVQGKFKKPLRYDQVFGGQEFTGGLRNIPGKWLIKWAFELLKPRLPKSFEADLFGPTPYFLSPLVLTAQKMRADEGEPQPVTDFEIEEEMGPILGEKFIGKNDDRGRKKAFSGAGALSTTYFDTDLVYTFDYFQQFLRSDQFALDLGVKLLDLSHYLGEQPLLLTMAKDMESGEYLWKFELWHERCIPLDKSR